VLLVRVIRSEIIPIRTPAANRIGLSQIHLFAVERGRNEVRAESAARDQSKIWQVFGRVVQRRGLGPFDAERRGESANSAEVSFESKTGTGVSKKNQRECYRTGTFKKYRAGV